MDADKFKFEIATQFFELNRKEQCYPNSDTVPSTSFEVTPNQSPPYDPISDSTSLNPGYYIYTIDPQKFDAPESSKTLVFKGWMTDFYHSSESPATEYLETTVEIEITYKGDLCNQNS